MRPAVRIPRRQARPPQTRHPRRCTTRLCSSSQAHLGALLSQTRASNRVPAGPLALPPTHIRQSTSRLRRVALRASISAHGVGPDPQCHPDASPPHIGQLRSRVDINDAVSFFLRGPAASTGCPAAHHAGVNRQSSPMMPGTQRPLDPPRIVVRAATRIRGEWAPGSASLPPRDRETVRIPATAHVGSIAQRLRSSMSHSATDRPLPQGKLSARRP